MSIINWTAEIVVEARFRWDRGDSALQIARGLSEKFKVKISKDAVVGKAHRLGFSPRPSPIKLVEKSAPVAANDATPVIVPTITPKPKPTVTPTTFTFLRPETPRFVVPSDKVCQWPIGEVRSVDFHFCGDAVVKPGQPYCETHHCQAHGGKRLPKPEQFKDSFSGEKKGRASL